jgi:hypothetical protein
MQFKGITSTSIERKITMRDHNKIHLALKAVRGLTAALVLGASGAANATPICLSPDRIDSTKVVDSKTIDFRMNDGTVYRNALRTPCQSAAFHGFAYVVRGGQICDNLQSIRVLRTHEVCVLGAFTKLPPKV